MNRSYAYVYDDFLADSGFERDVAALETQLSSYDLFGQVCRLALFRSAKELVEGVVRQGATTVVIVGNDATLDKTMWFLPDLDVTVGYIPIAAPSHVARLLGIPSGTAACDVLAARYVETIDMGKVDDRYFLTELAVPTSIALLDIEGKYRVSAADGGSLVVRNLGGRTPAGMETSNAQDGFLEAVISPREEEKPSLLRRRVTKPQATHILFSSGTVFSDDPIEAHVDNHVVSGFRFDVSVVPKKLRIITGRSRRLLPADALPRSVKNGMFRPATDKVIRLPRRATRDDGV